MAEVYEYRYTRHLIGDDLPAQIETIEDAVPHFRRLFAGSETEVLAVMALTPDLRIIGMHKVATGTQTSVAAALSDMFRYAVRTGADQMILAHNHVGYDATVSDPDINVAAHVQEAGNDFLNITPLGSLVITENDFSVIEQSAGYQERLQQLIERRNPVREIFGDITSLFALP